MRITTLYQVYDCVAQMVHGPILAQSNERAAVRMFTDALMNDKTSLGQHPEDYDLMEVGTQDEETGIITAAAAPRAILQGAQWKRTAEARNNNA